MNRAFSLEELRHHQAFPVNYYKTLYKSNKYLSLVRMAAFALNAVVLEGNVMNAPCSARAFPLRQGMFLSGHLRCDGRELHAAMLGKKYCSPRRLVSADFSVAASSCEIKLWGDSSRRLIISLKIGTLAWISIHSEPTLLSLERELGWFACIFTYSDFCISEQEVLLMNC